MDFKKNKLGQSLPLNTIVIAILVIIVLLVIVLFFTGKIGDSGAEIDAQTNNIKDCSLQNAAISSLYKSASFESECSNDQVVIPGITKKDEDGNVVEICCGTKK